MRTILFVTSFIFLCCGQIEGKLERPVIGEIEGVRNTSIIGWACQRSYPFSIVVHVYAGGGAGQASAKIVKPARADKHSEIAIANKCREKDFRNNRFEIDLTNEEILKHGNKFIYIHGISAVDEMPNSLLRNSARFRIPRFVVATDPGKPSPLANNSPLPTEKTSAIASIAPKVSITPKADKEEESDGGVSDGLGTIIGSTIGGICVVAGAVVGAVVGVRRYSSRK